MVRPSRPVSVEGSRQRELSMSTWPLGAILTGTGGALTFRTRYGEPGKGPYTFEDGFPDKVFTIAKDKGIHGGALEVKEGRYVWPKASTDALAKAHMMRYLLKKFPGRTRTIHIKEHQDKTFESDFYKEVFHLCETSSATQWYIVEMGGPEGNGFEVPRQALEKLHRLGK